MQRKEGREGGKKEDTEKEKTKRKRKTKILKMKRFMFGQILFTPYPS
jgi:hypothetical protein